VSSRRPTSTTIADLQRLPELLRRRGYDETAVAGVLHGNWLRFFGRRGTGCNALASVEASARRVSPQNTSGGRLDAGLILLGPLKHLSLAATA